MALATLALLTAGPAAAQNTGDAAPTLLPEVNVQGQRATSTGPVEGYVATESAGATKTDTPLIETPQSVSVITRDRIDDQAARNVDEALRYTPGVTTGLGGNDARFDSVRIRGFDGRNSQYLDGLRLLRQFGPTAIEQYGLERIEVIRGPNSVLYGQTAPGGLINLVSKRPTATPFGEVNLQAGSFGRVQGAFDLGGPATEDGQWLYRLTGLVRNSGTQVDHVDDDRYFVAPAVTWRPSGDTTLTLLGRFQYDQGSSPVGLPAQGTLYPTPYGRISRSRFAGEESYNRSDVRTESVGWNFEHRFNEVWSVRQNARYLHNDVAYETLYGSGLEANQRTLRRGSLTQRENYDTVNLDNTAEARFNTGPLQHTVLFGVDYRQYWGNYQSYFGTAPDLDLYAPVRGLTVRDARLTARSPTNRNDDYNQTGIYAQDQLRFGNWLLTLGGRQDWSATSQTPLTAGPRIRSNDDAFTGRVALLYAFDFGLSPYFSYSTSFDPVLGATNKERGSTPFQPTRGKQYEAGVKYQPPGRNSTITAALFDLTQTNVTTRDPVYASSQVQTGEIRSRGLELEAVASLSDGLSLVASYTLLDAEITGSNALVPGTTRTTRGNVPALVPKNQANLWAKYEFQQDQTLAGVPLAGLGLAGGLRYVGDLYGDDANIYRSPSVGLVDAAVSYKLGRYRFSVNASNLFDKKYVASCQGQFYCYYGNRLTVIGNVGYRW